MKFHLITHSLEQRVDFAMWFHHPLSFHSVPPSHENMVEAAQIFFAFSVLEESPLCGRNHI